MFTHQKTTERYKVLRFVLNVGSTETLSHGPQETDKCTVSYNMGLQGLQQCLQGVLEGLLTQAEIREGSQELKGKEK